MCTFYRPTAIEEIREKFDGQAFGREIQQQWNTMVHQDDLAPILIRAKDGRLETILASFGMIPQRFYENRAAAKHTMNARAETLSIRKAYKTAWQQGRHCLIPMRAFYEPSYKKTKFAVRTRLGMQDDSLFAVAGLYDYWDDHGEPLHTFTMITINADDHAVMNRMHKPLEEKRMPVILREAQYLAWLNCIDPKESEIFLQQFPAEEMKDVAEPLKSQLTDLDKQLDLF